MPSDKISAAAESLRQGKMILIYDGDGREGEADLVLGAGFATPGSIETLRKEAGGLICAAMDKPDAERLGLPFLSDLLQKAGGSVADMICDKTAYGDKPAFSLQVNHRKVFTGITDNDRSLTLRKVDEFAVGKADSSKFAKEFYCPGHIFLLIGRGLKNRRGHTELSLAIGRKAGLKVMVLCEMLGKGNALPKKDAMEYARKNGLAFLEGKEIIETM